MIREDDGMYFDDAFERTSDTEGGYSNDPNDPGGETYRGISRVYHPDWPGWALIDQYKRQGLSLSHESTTWDALAEHVTDFFHRTYWVRAGCNRLATVDVEVAMEVYDTAVNMGVHRAVSILQRSLNLLNTDTRRTFEELEVDGLSGKLTLAATLAVKRQSAGIHALLVYMNVLQGMEYIEAMERRPSLEKYARGWATRVWFTKRRKGT